MSVVSLMLNGRCNSLYTVLVYRYTEHIAEDWKTGYTGYTEDWRIAEMVKKRAEVKRTGRITNDSAVGCHCAGPFL